MPQSLRYWIYTGNSGVAKIHRSDCGNCKDGKGATQIADHIGVSVVTVFTPLEAGQ